MNRVETMRALLIPTVLALVVSACSSTRAPAGSGDSRTIYPVDLPPGFGEADWMVTGPPSSPYFGDSLAEAGDTNGDGYDDFLVLATNVGYHGTSTVAYLYEGSATGPADTPEREIPFESDWGSAGSGDFDGDGYSDVLVGADLENDAHGAVLVYAGSAEGLSTTPVTTLDGVNRQDYYGTAVSGVGDVDGDGYDDAMIGAAGVDSFRGAAYLYLGSPSGLQALPTSTVQGTTEHDSVGQEVDGAGDVNGDGFPDVIVSAPGVNSWAGVVYVYLGSASGLSATAGTTVINHGDGRIGSFAELSGAGDVNGDGFSDIVVGDPPDARVYFGSATGTSITPSVHWEGDFSFGWPVSDAGDVDADGYDDVLVGEPDALASNGEADGGRAWLYLGSGNGPATEPDIGLVGADEPGTLFGAAVAGVGDVNGDGYDDVVIGAYGAAWLYLGRPTTSGADPDSGAGGDSAGDTGGSADQGCACASPGGATPQALALLAGALLTTRRRRPARERSLRAHARVS